MSANRQYVLCKFRVEDTRTYTYANDGEPVQPGDAVRVPDRCGDGWKKVFVVDTHHETPPFECKPILGLHIEDEPAADSLPLARAPDHHPNSAAALMAERG